MINNVTNISMSVVSRVQEKREETRPMKNVNKQSISTLQTATTSSCQVWCQKCNIKREGKWPRKKKQYQDCQQYHQHHFNLGIKR